MKIKLLAHIPNLFLGKDLTKNYKPKERGIIKRHGKYDGYVCNNVFYNIEEDVLYIETELKSMDVGWYLNNGWEKPKSGTWSA